MGNATVLTDPGAALGASGSTRGAYDEFWNANYPLLRGVPRVGLHDEVVALRIGIGQQLKDLAIQPHRLRLGIPDLFEPGANFLTGS